MSLRIFIIPTGESIESAAPAPSSLDALRQWVAKATSIPTQDQILLTTKGKHVKLQTLLTETELYLYDRELFTSPTAKENIPQSQLPDSWAPEDFPNDLHNSNSLKSWQKLFIERREWAQNIYSTCKSMCRTAEDFILRRQIIEKGLHIATLNHEGHLQNLETKHGEAKTWLEDISRDTLRPWEEDLTKLGSLPANPGFVKLFGMSEAAIRKASASNTTLASLIDRPATKKAAADSNTILGKLEAELGGFSKAIQKISSEYDGLMKDLASSQSRSLRDDPEEPSKQLDEIKAIANKVAADCDHVLGLKTDPKSLAAASKIALLNTRNFLPNLRDYAKEIDDLVRHCIEQKNAVVDRALNNLLTIASIESSLDTVSRQLGSFNISDEGINAFNRVALPGRLPLIYGSLLLEARRRKEWVEKMKRDSATIAEELAGYQEEEQKRRKRWLKGVNDVLVDVADAKVLGVEISLHGEDHSWPDISSEDIEKYLKALQSTSGMDDTLDTLAQMIREADRPTKQQVKRAKAFKMGSVHDAGLGKGSLLLRGEDEMKVLQDMNKKLEDDVKGYKSRIRKLEDVLHRQSHSTRLSMTGATQNSQFPEPRTPIEFERSHPVGSPRGAPAELSRPPSVASRRFSSNQGQEDKNMARRLVQLESELAAEKDARAKLVKDAQSKEELEQATNKQIEEANSTKRDLMENMEAQQREFADERRSLEDELNKYKLKVEEMEDELENLLGSRDNERTGLDARLQSLVSELEQVRTTAANDVKEAQARADRSDAALRKREEADVERNISLKGIYSSLSPDQPVPEDPAKLLPELEEVAQRSTDHAREISQAIALAKSENENLQSLLDGHKNIAAELKTELETRETDLRNLQEELTSEKEKASSLNSELEGEREHLKDLRSKFAEGETGSESLRNRIEEEEAKVTSLSAKLAESKSHVNSLDVELLSFQSKYRQLHELHDANRTRLEERSQRAKTVTQRLYAQNDRINRLLEGLGFLVTYEDDSMVVQRASKASTSTILLEGAGGSLTRSVTPPTKRLLDDLSDLSSLLWMEKDSPDDEAAKFAEYMKKIEKFNLDIFSDAVSKRMKDIEHTARKWQKEARGYRDKAHRAQSEANEKIAFRSFKEGDLALFLPTRNQATRPWAAFNVGAPHYFLREQDTHKLGNKEWLVARITKVEERIVDLSKTMEAARAATSDGHSIAESDGTIDDDNPFDLSDGLRWYLLDAQEEKLGAPSTPGLGKATVSAANVDARGSIRVSSVKKRPNDAGDEATKALSRSLDSRRSSTGSKKSAQIGLGVNKVGSNEALRRSEDSGEHTSTGRSPGGPGPSHLRTTSDASSMFPTTTDTGEPAKTDAQLQEEDGVNASNVATAPIATPTKPSPFSPLSGLRRNPSSQSSNAVATANGSPSKNSQKSPAKGRNGYWDSLFNLDISLGDGNGGKKKT